MSTSPARYCHLGDSGLKVSVPILGCMGLALAWLGRRVVDPVIGFNSVEQIEQAIFAGGKYLTEKEKYLEKLYQAKNYRGVQAFQLAFVATAHVFLSVSMPPVLLMPSSVMLWIFIQQCCRCLPFIGPQPKLNPVEEAVYSALQQACRLQRPRKKHQELPSLSSRASLFVVKTRLSRRRAIQPSWGVVPSKIPRLIDKIRHLEPKKSQGLK
ncbi:hypothetical protein BJX99DRAFT_46577 [Aspergillus californicus]